tara:strand:+ start:263 stop:937 length:675 start_codon:yes stop_codon:yes gene_type:complete
LLKTILLYKPFGFLSQFSPEPNSRWRTLSEIISETKVYAAGRLDADSEGLLILTDNGRLQHHITNPNYGHWRSYWVQVEGTPTSAQLDRLRSGVIVQNQRTRPARADWLQGHAMPTLPERDPPIRVRKTIPTSWLELSLQEGRNRQVRRMTAAVGLPTLRLVRFQIDLMDRERPLSLEGLQPGEWRYTTAEETTRMQRLIRSGFTSSTRQRRRASGQPRSPRKS